MRGASLHATIRDVVPVWDADTALYRQLEAVDALCLPGGAVTQLISKMKDKTDV